LTGSADECGLAAELQVHVLFSSWVVADWCQNGALAGRRQVFLSTLPQTDEHLMSTESVADAGVVGPFVPAAD
jgi:hypothetical protein